MIQISQQTLILPDAGEVAALKKEFNARRCIILPELIHPQLLQKVLQGVAAGDFYENAYTTPKDEIFATDLSLKTKNIAVHLVHFIMNNKDLFKVMQDITGCREIKGFTGRIYKNMPGEGHKLDWHEDTFDPKRILALSINLSTEQYTGAAFQIRKKGTTDILREVPCGNPGDTHVFDIHPSLEHRVTETTGTHPRVAAAGWFISEPFSSYYN